jgi:hypothetical protein
VTYYYALYGVLPGGGWGAPVVASVIPLATFDDESIDVQEIVRERIDVTLHSMIQRGKILLSRSTVPVVSIPFYTQGGEFPVVTVLYANGSTVVRGLGEMVSQEIHDGSSWVTSSGWHTGVSLEISAWSLNADERIILRKALQAAIAANLDVFEEAGLNLVEVQSVRDTEDTQSMNAPLYETIIVLSCQAAVAVTDTYGSFVDVSTTTLGV